MACAQWTLHNEACGNYQDILIKELFIVEGKSAESTVIQAMDKRRQAVFALQGKILNAEKASRQKLLANLQCRRLLEQLQCGTGADCQPAQLVWSRLNILFDPDIDGVHARVLLVSLIRRLLFPLVEANRVWLVLPPLYRVTTHDQRCLFAWSESGLQSLLQAADTGQQPHVARLKGIAQLNSDDCYRLLLQPDSRKQLLLRPDDVRTL